MTKAKCQTKDCTHGAKVAPKVCVPATGWPLDMHQTLQAMMGIELCEKCFAELKPADLFGQFDVDGKNNLREVFIILARNGPPPDFERAYFERMLISSEEYQDFKRRASEKKEARSVH